MLKEKLSQIRHAESTAVQIVEDANRIAQARLRETDDRARESEQEVLESVDVRATVDDKTARAETKEASARIEEAGQKEIAQIRADSEGRTRAAVRLILGYVTDGLID